MIDDTPPLTSPLPSIRAEFRKAFKNKRKRERNFKTLLYVDPRIDRSGGHASVSIISSHLLEMKMSFFFMFLKEISMKKNIREDNNKFSSRRETKMSAAWNASICYKHTNNNKDVAA